MTEFKSETCNLAGEQGLVEWLLTKVKVAILHIFIIIKYYITSIFSVWVFFSFLLKSYVSFDAFNYDECQAKPLP